MTSFAIDPNRKELVERWAKDEERTFASMIRKLIEDEVQRRGDKEVKEK